MNQKDKKRHYAYEALTILGCLALFLFILRLWPILLLAILGIFIAVIRLLFLSAKEVEEIAPKQLPAPVPREPTAGDMQAIAFYLIQKRITELLTARYPQVRWVWENTKPKEDIMAGQAVYILLNRAGGYRRGLVVIQNLQVCDVVFCAASPDTGQPKPVNGGGQSENDGSEAPHDPEDSGAQEDLPVDYGLIAFEWVEAHILELNDRCNETIGQGASEILIPAEELPEKESWQDICRELIRNGLENPECCGPGITIKFEQETAERK